LGTESGVRTDSGVAMAKPETTEQFSLDSAREWDDAPGIPDWSHAFFQHVYLKLDKRRLASMYKKRGRPPVSPRLLAAVTILQYVENVSDRGAVKNLFVRRDWRVAVNLGSNYRGFCPTVLVRFRQRLMASGLEEELFGSVLGEIRRLGMLEDRRCLRVDGTRLLADVSHLTRGDLVGETIRLVLRDLCRVAPELEGDAEFERLWDLYGSGSWLGQACSAEKLLRMGQDGYAALTLCEGREVGHAGLLQRVLRENFGTTDGKLRALELSEMESDRVRTPHEPDALLGVRRSGPWTGDEVHLVETADAGLNVVVGVVVTDPRQEDSTVLEEVRELGLAQVPEAEVLLADTGYGTIANIVESEEAGVDLVSPPRNSTRQNGYQASDFHLDFKGRVARCPAGHENASWVTRPDGTTFIRWSASLCAACPLRQRCTTCTQGRRLELAPSWERLHAGRIRAKTDEFRELYRHRAAIEATISELVHRHGFRRSRYRGAPRRRLHAILAVTALNAKRMLRWIAEGGSEGAASRRTAACGA